MNKVHMKLEYDKLKEDYKDIHEVINQGDSVVLSFDDENVEACVGNDGSLYFQISTYQPNEDESYTDDIEESERFQEISKKFYVDFPFFKDALSEDEEYAIFERPVEDFKLIREVLEWIRRYAEE